MFRSVTRLFLCVWIYVLSSNLVMLSCAQPMMHGQDLYLLDSLNDPGDEPNTVSRKSWQGIMWMRYRCPDPLFSPEPVTRLIPLVALPSNTQPALGTLYIPKDVAYHFYPRSMIVPHHSANEAGMLHENQWTTKFIYIPVLNRGDCASQPGARLRLYYSKAATTLHWPVNWIKYRTSDQPNIYQGDEILEGGVPLPSIPADSACIIQIPWIAPPASSLFKTRENRHYCVLARIESGSEPGDPWREPAVNRWDYRPRQNWMPPDPTDFLVTRGEEPWGINLSYPPSVTIARLYNSVTIPWVRNNGGITQSNFWVVITNSGDSEQRMQSSPSDDSTGSTTQAIGGGIPSIILPVGTLPTGAPITLNINQAAVDLNDHTLRDGMLPATSSYPFFEQGGTIEVRFTNQEWFYQAEKYTRSDDVKFDMATETIFITAPAARLGPFPQPEQGTEIEMRPQLPDGAEPTEGRRFIFDLRHEGEGPEGKLDLGGETVEVDLSPKPQVRRGSAWGLAFGEPGLKYGDISSPDPAEPLLARQGASGVRVAAPWAMGQLVREKRQRVTDLQALGWSAERPVIASTSFSLSPGEEKKLSTAVVAPLLRLRATGPVWVWLNGMLIARWDGLASVSLDAPAELPPSDWRFPLSVLALDTYATVKLDVGLVNAALARAERLDPADGAESRMRHRLTLEALAPRGLAGSLGDDFVLDAELCLTPDKVGQDQPPVLKLIPRVEKQSTLQTKNQSFVTLAEPGQSISLMAIASEPESDQRVERVEFYVQHKLEKVVYVKESSAETDWAGPGAVIEFSMPDEPVVHFQALAIGANGRRTWAVCRVLRASDKLTVVTLPTEEQIREAQGGRLDKFDRIAPGAPMLTWELPDQTLEQWEPAGSEVGNLDQGKWCPIPGAVSPFLVPEGAGTHEFRLVPTPSQ
jgi:hypothetical protein